MADNNVKQPQVPGVPEDKLKQDKQAQYPHQKQTGPAENKKDGKDGKDSK